MTQEIKQRIEQIRNGEVPEGYKQTKVGIIPNEWEVKRLKDKFVRIIRKNTEGNTNVLTISAKYGLINQEDFFNKAIASEDKTNYYLLNKGEFAYNKSYSNGYPFGAIKPLIKYEKGIVSPLYICFAAKKENKSNMYFQQYFECGKLNSEIHSFAQEGARNHGLLNLSVNDFFNSYIVLPSDREQKTIAEILAMQDRVIELKEKLLEEKIKQNKYLAKQLLTGRKRLKGYKEEWRKNKLINLLKERKTYSSKCEEYPHVTLSTEGIVLKSERYDREHLVKTEEKKYKITQKGDICYNPANLKFGVICINDFGKAIFSPIYVTFEVVEGLSSRFIAEYLTRWDFINAVLKYEEGTVYERMAVKPKDFLKHEILLPPFKEQCAIAEVLSAGKKEIELLRHSICEEKQKKKISAQLLFSGIVRT